MKLHCASAIKKGVENFPSFSLVMFSHYVEYCSPNLSSFISKGVKLWLLMVTLNEDLMNKSWKIKLETTTKINPDPLFPGSRDVSNWEIKDEHLKALQLGHLKQQANGVYQEIKNTGSRKMQWRD